MSLPDQTAAPAANSALSYRGLYLVSALPTQAPAESAASNLLYPVAAVGAALFLVTTIF
jgi:hypothetical protein